MGTVLYGSAHPSRVFESIETTLRNSENDVTVFLFK